MNGSGRSLNPYEHGLKHHFRVPSGREFKNTLKGHKTYMYSRLNVVGGCEHEHRVIHGRDRSVQRESSNTWEYSYVRLFLRVKSFSGDYSYVRIFIRETIRT